MLRSSELTIGLYVVTQESREDGGLLLLADRKKTKAFWWTRDLNYAITFRRKSVADEAASKYKFNNAKVQKLSDINIQKL